MLSYVRRSITARAAELEECFGNLKKGMELKFGGIFGPGILLKPSVQYECFKNKCAVQWCDSNFTSRVKQNLWLVEVDLQIM